MPEEKGSSSTTGSSQDNEGKRYALVVGVNKSIKARSLPALQYAESDAAGIAFLLKQKECNFAFPSGLLIGEAANTQNVRKAIIDLIHGKSENDLLLFYFIGHGCLVETRAGEIGVYLVTSDFDPDPRQAIYCPEAYLSLDWIREVLYEHQKKANVIGILDCCDAGYITEPPSPKRQLTQLLKTFATKIERTEQLLASSHRTWAILASTEKGTSAYEYKGHTLMTGMILDALNGDAQDALNGENNLTLGTLHEYLQIHMEEQESGKQHPIMQGTFHNRLILARHPSENRVPRSPKDYPKSPFKQPFDMAISSATFGDLDFEQVRIFLKKERILIQRDYRANLDEKAQMQDLGLLRDEYPSYGAWLCFGHHPQLEIVGAYTRCIDWTGTTRRSSPLNANNNKEYRGSLFRQFEQACDFLRNHLRYESKQNGGSKQPEIPFRVLEEALANALIHREYVTSNRTVQADCVRVQIFSNRVEIGSPGRSPIVPLDGNSHPRNPQIMRIFYLAKHVENTGTGIMRIQELMEEAGLPWPDIRTSEQTFTIVLSRPTQAFALAEQVNGGTPVLVDPSSSDENDPPPIGSEPTTVAVSSVVNTTPLTPGLVTPTSSEAPTTDNGGIVTPPLESTPDPNHGQKPKQLVGLTTSPGFRRSLLATFGVLGIVVVIIGMGMMSYYVYPLIPTPTPVPTSTTIEIASDFPTTGVDNISGLPLQNGVQMAITEANNEHLLPGYTLKLAPYNDVGSDNRHDPTIGAKNLTQAIANNLIAGVIGPYNSTVALKELPIVNHAPLALLSPDAAFSCLTKSDTDDPTCTETNDIVTQMRPTGQLTFFRLATTTDRQGKANADYFTKHHSKVLLQLQDDSDLYSLGLAQVFQREWQRMGGLVTSIDLPENTSNEQDYQNKLQAAASSPPDLIYFSGGLPNGIYVLKALSNIATLKMVPFASGDPVMKDSFLQKVAELHRDAPVYISLTNEDPAHSGTSTGADFEANYIASGYQDYVPDAATAYDCTMMLIQAIKTALQKGVSTPHGTQDRAGAVQFRQAVLQELRHLSYTGATGTHSFDTNGDTTNHTISFYQADLSTLQPSWKWLEQVTT